MLTFLTSSNAYLNYSEKDSKIRKHINRSFSLQIVPTSSTPSIPVAGCLLLAQQLRNMWEIPKLPKH